jgi:hypothetical protein
MNICSVILLDRFKIDNLIEEHTIAILISLNSFSRRSEVLQQQDWSELLWNGSCKKEVGGSSQWSRFVVYI